MGAGAPMLGDLKKTNFEKPESEGGAALQFELEANNFDLNSRETLTATDHAQNRFILRD